jgi:menaquinone-dependent protoporphyrinogen IX oxidase
MTKALIVYGTRYGATASTSEEIAEVLRKDGFGVRVVNAKGEKVRDISEYELVIVGSGIQINRWTKEPEKFLKKFQKELAKKKVALFVCCGSAQPLTEEEEKSEAVGRARRKYLEEKAAKCNLQPVALGLFGGVYDFNRWPWWAGKAKPMAKQQLDAAGFKETQPGIYDTRDWNAIRSWAKELAQKVHS